jgi:hypothetical protein
LPEKLGVTIQNYSCPQCGQVNSVSKVSALVSSGISVSYLGSARTDLDSRLRALSKLPTYESPWGGISALFLIATAVFVAFAAVGWVVVLASSMSPSEWERVPGQTWGWTAAAVLSLPIAIFMIISKVNQVKIRRAWVASAYPRWQRARMLWDELYYCARNDIVFLPSRPGAYAPVSEMDEFLMRQAGE